jgi:hypothetical protein
MVPGGEQNAFGGHLTEALHHLTTKELKKPPGAKQAWPPKAFCSPPGSITKKP